VVESLRPRFSDRVLTRFGRLRAEWTSVALELGISSASLRSTNVATVAAPPSADLSRRAYADDTAAVLRTMSPGNP